jgi:hypothetical protein
MNRKKNDRDKEYRPPRWISIFILIATITIPIVLIFLAGSEFNLTNAFLAAFSAMGIIALVELKISKVVIPNSKMGAGNIYLNGFQTIKAFTEQ